MEIKNDTIYQLETKVILYKNRKYFTTFRNIFIKDILDYILTKNKSRMVSNSKIKESSNQIKEKIFYWNIVMKNIKREAEIIDYDLNNYKRSKNGEKEDEHFFQYLKNQTKVLRINNLVYLYLRRISIIKLNKLISISNRDKIPLINLMKIYLGLCSKNLMSLKRKIIIFKDEKNS